MGWLEQQVRKSGIALAALGALLLAGIVAFLVSDARYLKNLYAGPLEMAAKDVVAIRDADALDRYWVKLKPDEIIDTGVDHTSVSRRRRGGESRSVTGHYYVLRFGDRLVFAKTEKETKPEGMIVGALVGGAPDLLSPTASPQLRARFMPMLVDATPFGDRANWTLTISGVLALGALYLLARGMMHVTNPAGHAALVRLEKGGTPIAEASRRIAADLTAGNVVKIKGHSLTSGFLAKPGLLSFDVKPFDRLIWAYPQVTNKKIYGFIPAGSTQQALLGFADASVELQLRKDQTDPLFHHLSTHAPWALYGHSPEIAQAYAGQRAALIQHVEERKAQWAAHVAAQNAGAEHGAGGAEATGGDPKQPPA